jgi:C1A family cysteine protease
MALRYAAVPATVVGLKNTLVTTKRAVVFGFSCFESLQSDATSRTGIIPFPGPNEAQIGGHCVALRGYDSSSKLFRLRNSWGPSWGDKGDGYLPERYFEEHLAVDCWMLTAEMG